MIYIVFSLWGRCVDDSGYAADKKTQRENHTKNDLDFAGPTTTSFIDLLCLSYLTILK